MQPTPKRPARQWIFILITVICLLFALVYVLGSARKNSVLAIDPAIKSPLTLAASSPLRPENGGVRPTWSLHPQLISINETSSADLGKVEMAPLTGGVGPRTMTGLKCERVYYAADKGLCLTREVSYVTAKTTATIFGPDFQPQAKFSTPGIPSRARISPDGHRAAFTVFVIGHSYADLEMSTATFLLDTATGVPIANLEEFAVWRDGQLVPVAKAYSGLADTEIAQLDRWIRSHTTERFGPTRAVEPTQVFELAYEGIAASPRHKSGIALRFPRIRRWRHDKPASEADTLDGLRAVLESTLSSSRSMA